MTRAYAIDMGSVCAWQYFARETEPDGMLNGVRDWWHRFADSMKPEYVVACFDGGHARRKAIDPEYKLNRKAKPLPEEYFEQLKRAPALFDELGVPALRFDGEEADDAIASVVTQHAGYGVEVIVVSSDKDLGALVCEHVKLYDPRPDAEGNCRYWDAAGVAERLGVPPWRVADLLAMAGDSSDNIKGIKGIGKTYALVAIKQTRSMAELFRKAAKGELSDLKPSTQKIIAEGKAQFDHAMRLVELRCDLPVPCKRDAFRVGATRGANQ